MLFEVACYKKEYKKKSFMSSKFNKLKGWLFNTLKIDNPSQSIIFTSKIITFITQIEIFTVLPRVHHSLWFIPHLIPKIEKLLPFLNLSWDETFQLLEQVHFNPLRHKPIVNPLWLRKSISIWALWRLWSGLGNRQLGVSFGESFLFLWALLFLVAFDHFYFRSLVRIHDILYFNSNNLNLLLVLQTNFPQVIIQNANTVLVILIVQIHQNNGFFLRILHFLVNSFWLFPL